jgi:Ketopantoate reductase PanE/ApbA C terminal
MTRVPLGRIRGQEEIWRLAEAGMREVVAVANAEGVRLTEDDVQRTLTFVQGMPATWKASLAVDLEQGRRRRTAFHDTAGKVAGKPTDPVEEAARKLGAALATAVADPVIDQLAARRSPLERARLVVKLKVDPEGALDDLGAIR